MFLVWGLINFFCKGTDSKFSRLCRLCSFLQPLSSAVVAWNETLLTKHGSTLEVVQGLKLTDPRSGVYLSWQMLQGGTWVSLITDKMSLGAWATDAKSQLIGEDPDAGKDWRQKDEMVGWPHRLNEHEFEQTPGDSEGQGSLACYSPWGCKESDMT